MRFQAPRGTQDCLPNESHRWAWIESKFREHARLYGYKEIRTPTFEDTQLFVRSSGETSDVVSKEMYDFFDKGGRRIALKPEGTAPALRAAIEHSVCTQGAVTRLFYITPVFRYERPQKGRFRESHQFGLELLGSASPAADAEIIEATVRFYDAIGITGAEVLLNSLGRSECRSAYRAAILKHARGYLESQSDEVRQKAERNPLRLLDSKDPAAREALSGLPPITDFLEPESRQRFEELQALLTAAGVAYRLAPEIVRGLDYYTETVFEVHSTKLGAQAALCGGGRYDELIKELGGPPTPAVGIGMGIERALMVLEELGASPAAEPLDVYVVQATPGARDAAFKVARQIREGGLSATLDYEGKSLKAQLKAADREGARKAVLIGDEELTKGVATVRDLASGDQSEVALDAVAEAVRS